MENLIYLFGSLIIGILFGYTVRMLVDDNYKKQFNDSFIKNKSNKIKICLYEGEVERLKDELKLKQKELDKNDFDKFIQQSKEEVLTDLNNIGLLENVDVVVGFDGKVKGIKKPCKKE